MLTRRSLIAAFPMLAFIPGSLVSGDIRLAPNAILRLACEFGSEEKIRAALLAGASINGAICHPFGDSAGPKWPPLIAAIQKEQPDCVAALLERGADPNIISPGGTAAIYHASIVGCQTSTQVLLQSGADVHGRHRNGETALHYAARYNDLGIASLLLEHGADPLIRDASGRTSLHAISELLCVYEDDCEQKVDAENILQALCKHARREQVDRVLAEIIAAVEGGA